MMQKLFKDKPIISKATSAFPQNNGSNLLAMVDRVDFIHADDTVLEVFNYFFFWSK